MEAKGQSLVFLCNEQILEIPFFQRPYVWKEDNWREMWNDLWRDNGRHFLGSIILKRQMPQTNEPNRAIVIDGQQRLTTLNILMKAMYDSLDEQGKRNAFNAVSSALFYKPNAMSSEYLISIKHSFNDSKQFEEILGSVVSESGMLRIDSPLKNSLDAISEGESLKGCYKFFLEELKKKSQKEIIALFNSFFDGNNKILVVIDLDESDQEQQIFDTINSAGVRLTASDTIKNALFQRLIELSGNKEGVCGYYKKTWEATFSGTNDEQNYWSEQKVVGRLKRDNSELLLHAVAVIGGFYDVEEDTLSDLPKRYKEHFSALDEAGLKSLVSEIVEYAGIYKAHIPESDRTRSYSFDNQGERLSQILAESETSTFNPYILFLYKKFAGDQKTLQMRLSQLERLFVRHLIAGKSTKRFNKLCSELIGKIKDNAADFDSYIEQNIGADNAEVADGIRKLERKNWLGNLLLFWIELHRRAVDSKYGTKTLQYNFQLEHVMPQKWEENWSGDSVPFVDESGNPIMDESEGKNLRKKKIYSLGNMTLLNGKLNVSVSNNTFQKKIEGDGKKAGVRKYDSLSVTKDVIEEFDRDGIWNEQKISAREKELLLEILEIWG